MPNRRVRLPRTNVALGGSAMRPSAGRHTVLELKPKIKGGSLQTLKVFVAKETMRIERIVMETETESTIVHVSGHTPRDSLDDSLFEQERREK